MPALWEQKRDDVDFIGGYFEGVAKEWSKEELEHHVVYFARRYAASLSAADRRAWVETLRSVIAELRPTDGK